MNLSPSERIFAAVIFSGPIYLTLLSIVRAVVPRVGPESLASELMDNSFTIPLGLVLVPVLLFCIKRARQSKRSDDGKLSKWHNYILVIVLSEVACAALLPFGAIAPVRDLFSGPEVINVKGCQNYFTEKEDVYFSSFDLVTSEGKTINIKFTDSREESEFYAPVVKFCKDKGTSAVMSRYPHTGIIKEFTVKEK